MKKKISELGADELVEVQGVVLDMLKPSEYMGCPNCFRKNCYHLSRGLKLVQLYIPRFRISEGKGMVVVSLQPTRDERFEAFDELDWVAFKGRTGMFMDKVVLNALEYEVKKKFSIEEIRPLLSSIQR